jgi:hypothetical protein
LKSRRGRLDLEARPQVVIHTIHCCLGRGIVAAQHEDVNVRHALASREGTEFILGGLGIGVLEVEGAKHAATRNAEVGQVEAVEERACEKIQPSAKLLGRLGLDTSAEGCGRGGTRIFEEKRCVGISEPPLALRGEREALGEHIDQPRGLRSAAPVQTAQRSLRLLPKLEVLKSSPSRSMT